MYNTDTVQDNPIRENERVPFQYLINDIIPRSPELAYLYGIVQYYGALDSHIDEYLIINMESQDVSFAEATVAMLDLVYKGEGIFGGTEFLNSLATMDSMPVPYKDNPAMIISSINSLVSSTMMGYYSEWSGYGATRLATPNERIFEYAPISWGQIDYPGPSLGHRALRQ